MGNVPASLTAYFEKVNSILLTSDPDEDGDMLVCPMCLCGGIVAQDKQGGWVKAWGYDFCGAYCRDAWWKARQSAQQHTPARGSAGGEEGTR